LESSVGVNQAWPTSATSDYLIVGVSNPSCIGGSGQTRAKIFLHTSFGT